VSSATGEWSSRSGRTGEHEPTLGVAVSGPTAFVGVDPERVEAVWSANLPDDALDLRGVLGDERYDRVRTAFDATEPGEAFELVSDRDPTPVCSFLASLSSTATDPADVTPFEVERATPETWVFRTGRP